MPNRREPWVDREVPHSGEALLDQIFVTQGMHGSEQRRRREYQVDPHVRILKKQAYEVIVKRRCRILSRTELIAEIVPGHKHVTTGDIHHSVVSIPCHPNVRTRFNPTRRGCGVLVDCGPKFGRSGGGPI